MGIWQVFLQSPKLLNVHRGCECFPLQHLVVHSTKNSVFVSPISCNHLQSVLFRPSELVSPLLVQTPAQFLKWTCEIEDESSVRIGRGPRFFGKPGETISK